MTIEVIVLKAPRPDLYDLLQQNMWGFEVNFRISDALKPLQVGIDGRDLLLGGLEGQKPIVYGLSQEIRKWRTANAKTVKSGKKPALFRALGVGGGDRVIDATFGLGRDSCQLIAGGVAIEAYERVPELYFLARASQLWEGIDEEQLKIHFGSVQTNPQNLPIYFDPMFSDGHDRKAKSGKGMQVFHQLVGGDEDAMNEAKRIKNLTNRMVVKRAPKATQLLEGRNSEWTSKAVRFDLYL